MVQIPGGNMFMGDLDLSNARPPHKVTLSTFCMDRHEVNASAYDACVRSGNCLKAPQDVRFPGASPIEKSAFSELCNARRPDRSDHPINCVDWSMSDNFCRTAGGRLAKGGARLPTEAEWEFAARGSGQHTFPWGDEPPDRSRLNACGSECTAWFETHHLSSRAMYALDDGSPGTAPVGSFPAGASKDGVLDLAGNVWEWTADWYAPYGPEPLDVPKGPPKGTERVVRGGAFNGSSADWAKPAFRWMTAPDVYNHAIGFRCASDRGRD
jgi:formylglycine-generating enzyme required for sulfatase activity